MPLPASDIDDILLELRELCGRSDEGSPRWNQLITSLHLEVAAGAQQILRHQLEGLRAEAEDLYHDFLLKLCPRLRSFRCDRPRSGSRWTKIVLTHIARDFLRGRRRLSDKEPPDRPQEDLAPAWVDKLGEDEWQQLRATALELTRADHREDMARNIDMFYDRYVHDLKVDGLAVKYFGSNTFGNRNKVSVYLKRAAAKLLEAWYVLHPDEKEGS